MIHSLPIDEYISQRLAEFQAKLPPDEEIVGNPVTSEKFLFITTRKKPTKVNDNRGIGANKNLLLDQLEHFRKGKNSL